MNKSVYVAAALCAPFAVSAQGALTPALPPGNPAPTAQETRMAMGIPSKGDLRGQKDTVGFASTAEQMARVWELSEAAPAPEPLGPRPAPGAVAIICPHDDYLCAGRMYREVIPLVKARTVILVGVFHKHRRFGARDRMAFDTYRAWRAPDGEIKASALREELLAQLDPGEYVQNDVWHDSEHSLEAVAYWLKHQDPGVEIVPVILPATSFARLQAMAGHLGAALARSMQERGWKLGEDVAIVISSDGTHYGTDFQYTPYGKGGVDAFQQAMAHDRELLKGLLAGPVSADMARRFYGMMVDPADPTHYLKSWCGRFSIPFGLLLLESAASGLGLRPPKGMPIGFGASVAFPDLPVQALGMGATCPINLYHFVTFPSVAYVQEPQP
jgi:AmmeMemoRadiSam system protein B